MVRAVLAVAWLAMAAAPVLARERTFVVTPERSQVAIRVGKSGLLSFAGHQHEVVAPVLAGEVTADPEDLGKSSVSLSFQSASLRVTGKGEPPDDVPKVQANMLGPKVLDTARFAAISFHSVGVSGGSAGPGAWDLWVEGELGLHGVSRRLKLRLRVEIEGDTLSAAGTTVLRQTDFGITPLSVGGVVNVKNELIVTYRIVALAR